MTESEAMNKKCCFAFVESMADFLYCQTSLCMAWQKITDDEGTCLMLCNDTCETVETGISAMHCTP